MALAPANKNDLCATCSNISLIRSMCGGKKNGPAAIWMSLADSLLIQFLVGDLTWVRHIRQLQTCMDIATGNSIVHGH